MASSPVPPKSTTLGQLRSSIPVYVSKSHDNIAHVRRLLSTTKNLDTTLLTISYTLSLLNSFLPSLPSIPTTRSPLPSTPLHRLRKSLPPLAALLDEYRTLLRLSGLISICVGASNAYLHPPRDLLVRCLIAGQVASIALFQVLENGAFLARKGVLAWGEPRRLKALRWSCRAWMVYTALALIKSMYEARERFRVEAEKERGRAKDRGVKETGEEVKEHAESHPTGEVALADTKEGEKQTDAQKGTDQPKAEETEQQEDKWWRDWKRSVGINLAYAPMTVHYSFGTGFLNDKAIAALGCVVAWLSMGQAWEESR